MFNDLEVEMSATLRDLERKVADKIMSEQKGEAFMQCEPVEPVERKDRGDGMSTCGQCGWANPAYVWGMVVGKCDYCGQPQKLATGRLRVLYGPFKS